MLLTISNYSNPKQVVENNTSASILLAAMPTRREQDARTRKFTNPARIAIAISKEVLMLESTGRINQLV